MNKKLIPPILILICITGALMNKTIEVNLYPDHQQQDQQWIDLADKLHEIKQMLKFYKAEESKHLSKLKALSNNKDSIGGKFVFTMKERPGSVNYNEIPELTGVNLDDYRKTPVPCWNLITI